MERAQNRLSMLLELTSGLAERTDLQDIANLVLGTGLRAIAANRGTLCLLTADRASLYVVAHAGYDTEMMDSWRLFALDAPFPASDAVRSRAPIYLHSAAERAERYPIFATTGGDGASVMLPLNTRSETLGAIVFGFDGERDFDESDRSILDALATQCAIAVDRARLHEAAQRRQANLSFLADASAILADAGEDLERALQQLADLAAPLIADICSFHLMDSPNEARLVAKAFVESEQMLATEHVSAYRTDLGAAHGLGSVLRTGREVSWNDGESFINKVARDDEHRAALVAMNLGAGIIVPMSVHGRVLGACVFANHRQRSMSDEDRQLVRTLGERAAVLLDNARLLRLRREVTTDLQAALLPPSLPTIPGFDLGARYEPAHQGLDVGGDFYDVVAISPERWLLVIGDVTGHGAKAAAATGLVRHTIRSGAMLGMDPSEILDHANQAMRVGNDSLAPGTYCAVALAMLDTTEVPVSSGTSVVKVVIASGGHQPLMLRRADGLVEPVKTRGRLIGFFPTIDATQLTVDLYPGDTLVAFTDGITERHFESEWFDESDLTSLLATSDRTHDADALAGAIRDAAAHAFPNAPKDDMTILVLRRPSVQ